MPIGYGIGYNGPLDRLEVFEDDIPSQSLEWCKNSV